VDLVSAIALTVELSDEQVRSIAEQAAAIVSQQQTSSAPTWLNTTDAADYIAAKVGRVHDLVQLGKLMPRRDGRRLLFRRDELDAYLEADQ
jgi:excisionase family DNA binding protein